MSFTFPPTTFLLNFHLPVRSGASTRTTTRRLPILRRTRRSPSTTSNVLSYHPKARQTPIPADAIQPSQRVDAQIPDGRRHSISPSSNNVITPSLAVVRYVPRVHIHFPRRQCSSRFRPSAIISIRHFNRIARRLRRTIPPHRPALPPYFPTATIHRSEHTTPGAPILPNIGDAIICDAVQSVAHTTPQQAQFFRRPMPAVRPERTRPSASQPLMQSPEIRESTSTPLDIWHGAPRRCNTTFWLRRLTQFIAI